MKRFKVKLCLFHDPSVKKEMEVMAENAVLACKVAAQNEKTKEQEEGKEQQEWYGYEAELIK